MSSLSIKMRVIDVFCRDTEESGYLRAKMPSSVDAVKFKLLICVDISHLKVLFKTVSLQR